MKNNIVAWGSEMARLELRCGAVKEKRDKEKEKKNIML